MRFIRSLIITACLVAAPAIANAADWTTTESGSATCSVIRGNGICWLEDVGENSSAISVRQCSKLTVMVYGSGVSVMPEVCNDSSCTSSEALLANALTGDSPNTFMTSVAPFNFIRINWSSGTPTISIQCGR